MADFIGNAGLVSIMVALGIERPTFGVQMMQYFPFDRSASCDEVAASVMFLASDLSSCTSGIILTIDGGFA